LNLLCTFLTFVRDFFILSILPLPLLGSVAAGHRTIRFLFRSDIYRQQAIQLFQRWREWEYGFPNFPSNLISYNLAESE
jgi:hypothetical protein